VADGSVPTGAPFLAVDADGVGPSGFTDGSFDVKDISTLARALEINEMECFVLIDGCLRLYAPICGAEKLDLALRLGFGFRSAKGRVDEKKRQEQNIFHGWTS
jgi:hypothetical protein